MPTYDEIKQHSINRSVALNNAIDFVSALTGKERETIIKANVDLDTFIQQKFEFYLKLLEG
jgi:hypothetical protein